MARKLRLLIIGSDESLHTTWKTELGSRFNVTSVLTLEDAQVAIDEELPFHAIVIDSFEENNNLLAVPFIEQLRRTYRKHIIGMAKDYPRQLQMIQAGCTVFATPRNMPDTIFETFRLL